ncbi:MAG TPA: nucleotidyltransferase family protein [Verrucomicrobiae bacterium]|nr:nucleotidyltransferase family protein [Verrucomicrobiae bacterium]
MYAVITAGGPIDGEYAARAGSAFKALAPVRGRTMIVRTIEALHECGIDRIAVVGSDAVGDVCATVAPVKMIPDVGSGAKNVLGALDAWPDDAALLYLTCDMPYIDAAAVRWFLDRIEPATLSMPLCEHAAFVARFPGAPPFGVALGGERVVNAGIFHLPVGSRARVRTLAAAMFEARKAPWKMAWFAGPLVLLRFLLGRASVNALEQRATDVLGIPVVAMRNAPPELAYDADTAAEYAYALDHA